MGEGYGKEGMNVEQMNKPARLCPRPTASPTESFWRGSSPSVPARAGGRDSGGQACSSVRHSPDLYRAR